MLPSVVVEIPTTGFVAWRRRLAYVSRSREKREKREREKLNTLRDEMMEIGNA
jgi:hypothetical protein